MSDTWSNLELDFTGVEADDLMGISGDGVAHGVGDRLTFTVPIPEGIDPVSFKKHMLSVAVTLGLPNPLDTRIIEMVEAYGFVELKRLPRDGDGDGFIWDGTPRMAPLAPLRAIYDAADGAGPLLAQGAESNIWVNIAPDGNAVVVKKFNANIFTKGDPKMAADREILAHDVAEALGVNVPRMERVSETEIIMDYVPTEDGPIPSMKNLAKVNGAREVALLDYATGNPDRHQGNVLLDSDGDIVAIDQGHAWWEAPGLGGNKPIHPQYGAPGVRPEFIEIDRASAFRGYGARPKVLSHDYTLVEIEQAIVKVERLKPEFDALDRSDWHRKTIERLESLKPVAIEKASA